MVHPTIAIHAQHAPAPADAAPGAGCGGCSPAEPGDRCQQAQVQPCVAARLSGPADQVRRLVEALAQRLGFPPDAPHQGGVCALAIGDGEVELQLTGAAHCGPSAERADLAFQTLRALLPDTDIYISRTG